ncbi:MAG: sugar transferase [Planctomycetota bacterium]
MLHRRTTGVTTLLLDLACAVCALWAGGLHAGRATEDAAGFVAIASVYLLTWVLMAERLGTYLVPFHRGAGPVLRAVLENWGITAAVAGFVEVTMFGTPSVLVWRVVAVGAMLLVIQRMLLLRTPLSFATHVRPRVLLIGAHDGAADLARDRDARRSFDLRGYVPFPGERDEPMAAMTRLGSIDRLDEVLSEHRIDLCLVCPSERAVMGDVHRVFQICDWGGLSAQFFPAFLDLDNLHASLTWIDGRLGLSLHSLPNRSLAMFAKRLIDLVGAALGLLLLLPAFVACGLAVKLTSRGPVFFPQIRVGRNGEHFRCLKFRTMKVGAQLQQEDLRKNSIQDGPAFKIPDDPRLTRVGGFLRRYSLDELPQLLNVLIGDMSLVGPRPPIPSEVDRYTWWQRRRISVKPGLTCVWQVWGRNRVSFKRWVEMDLYYIDNWSLWLDLKLIVHTVRAVVRGTGM